MERRAYGVVHNARTNVRQHRSARTLGRVSGVASTSNMSARTVSPVTARAIYGSTDRAVKDHSNDALCVVVDDAKQNYTSDPTRFRPAYNTSEYVGRYSELNGELQHIAVPKAEVPVLEPLSVDFYVRRATQHGMTLVDYCSMVGVQI